MELMEETYLEEKLQPMFRSIELSCIKTYQTLNETFFTGIFCTTCI